MAYGLRWTGAILLYRSTCAKCRVISLAVVCLSVGLVRRVPLSSPEAGRLYEEHGVRPGKLALVGGERMFTGWYALPGVLALLVLAALSALRKLR